MPVLELECPKTVEEEPTPTRSEPRLRGLARRLLIGSSAQDNSLTVIENPVFDGKIGYLFAGRFLQTRSTTRLEQAHHFRVDLNTLTVKERYEYPEVHFKQGFDQGRRLRYTFLVAEEGTVLQNPSVEAYETCFLESDLYNQYLGNLGRRGQVEQVLEEINATLAQKVKSFGLDPETNSLVIPDNYATLSLSELSRLQK